MIEERLTVLRMLEKGVINAQEAERLLLALASSPKESSVGEALDKAGDAIVNFARNVSDKAEIFAEKAEPKFKKAVKNISEKASNLKDDIKDYAEKKKKEREEEKKRQQEFFNQHCCNCSCDDDSDVIEFECEYDEESLKSWEEYEKAKALNNSCDCERFSEGEVNRPVFPSSDEKEGTTNFQDVEREGEETGEDRTTIFQNEEGEKEGEDKTTIF